METNLKTLSADIQTCSLSELENIATVVMDAIALRPDTPQVVDLLAYYDIEIGQDAQGYKPCRKPRPRPCS